MTKHFQEIPLLGNIHILEQQSQSRKGHPRHGTKHLLPPERLVYQ